MNVLNLVGLWLVLVELGVDAGSVTIPLTNDHDVIYRGKISVGEPTQTFEAIFHTGCTLTRFPARGCTASGRFPDACKDKNTYNPEVSTSARPHKHTAFEGGKPNDMDYASTVGEVKDTVFGAQGREYYDKLSFGTPNTKNFVEVNSATVGAADKLWGFDHSVVCLSSKSTQTNNSTFYDMLNGGVLTQSLMTVVYRKCDQGLCEDGGAVTFGGPDLANCDSDIHWVMATLGSYLWRFQSYSAQSFSISINGKLLIEKASANLDSGESLIQIHKSYMPTVLSTFKARKQGKYYLVGCDSKLEFSFLINGRQIVVNEKQLVLNQRVGKKCVLAITQSTFGSRAFILGAPFFRATCVVHDIGEPKRIGFAAVKSP